MQSNKSNKKVLFITRPICLPWDEASKNFAFFLAKSVPDHKFSLLTKGVVPEIPNYIEQIPIYTNGSLKFGFDQKLKLLKLFFKANFFDVIHLMFTPTPLNAIVLKYFFFLSRTKTVQTIATLREDLYSDEKLKKILYADHIITYSDYAKNKLAALGINNVTRIYPGIDIELYKKREEDQRVLDLFNIKRDDFVIMFPGEYTRLGAMDDIISILPELFAKLPAAKCMLACRIKNEADAEKKKAVEQQLKDAGISEKVIFTDTYSDMPKLYNACDVVLFPVQNMKGKFDVPLAVIEAMACEKPVIISDLPVLKEFASQNNSVIIEKGNRQMLLDSILQLASNLERKNSIEKYARSYVEENFDIKRVAEAYKNLYDKI